MFGIDSTVFVLIAITAGMVAVVTCSFRLIMKGNGKFTTSANVIGALFYVLAFIATVSREKDEWSSLFSALILTNFILAFVLVVINFAALYLFTEKKEQSLHADDPSSVD